jgi:hypothetical protein
MAGLAALPHWAVNDEDDRSVASPQRPPEVAARILAFSKILAQASPYCMESCMADFRARSDTLRANEQTKHYVGVATAWANALAIAAVARIGLRGALDLYGVGWLIIAAIAILGSAHALNLLEAEDRDD